MTTVYRRLVLGSVAGGLTLLAGCSALSSDGDGSGLESEADSTIDCQDGSIPPDVDLQAFLQSAGGDWAYVGETDLEPPPADGVSDTATARIEGPPGEVFVVARRYESVAAAKNAPLYGIRAGPIVVAQIGAAEQTTVSAEERGSLFSSFDCVSEDDHLGQITLDNSMIFSTSYDIQHGTSSVTVSATVEATIAYGVEVALVKDGEASFDTALITEEDLTDGTTTVDIDLFAPEAGEYTVRYSRLSLSDQGGDDDGDAGGDGDAVDTGRIIRTDTIEITDPYPNLAIESVTFRESVLAPFEMVVSHRGTDSMWMNVVLLGPSGDRLAVTSTGNNPVSLDPTGGTDRMEPGQYTLQIRIDEDRTDVGEVGDRVLLERELEYSGPDVTIADVSITTEAERHGTVPVAEFDVTLVNAGDIPAVATGATYEIGSESGAFDFSDDVAILPESPTRIELSPSVSLPPGQYDLTLTIESGEATLVQSTGEVSIE